MGFMQQTEVQKESCEESMCIIKALQDEFGTGRPLSFSSFFSSFSDEADLSTIALILSQTFKFSLVLGLMDPARVLQLLFQEGSHHAQVSRRHLEPVSNC